MSVPWRRSARLDADAADYFARVEGIGGGFQNNTYPEKGTKRRISDFFVSLKDLGLWPSVSELGVFLGVANLPSCLVKARYAAATPPMLTNFNFVAGDFTPTGAAGGLKGDGSTKYLSSGVDQATLKQNDLSIWVYISNPVTTVTTEILIGGVNSGGGVNFWKDPVASGTVTGRISSSATTGALGAFGRGLIGFSRTSSSSVNWITNAVSGSISLTSAAIPSGIITPFARAGTGPTQSAIALYGFGSALDLAALRAACDSVFAAFGGTP